MSAYISEYGMQDSVLCKCKGLNEVGRLIKGEYVPNVYEKKSSGGIIGKTLEDIFSAGDYAFAKIKTDLELGQMGHKFQNALQDPSQRTSYMSRGSVWVAIHQKDDERSIIFFIDNQKKLQNFYLKQNKTPDPKDKEFVINILKQKNLIDNY